MGVPASLIRKGEQVWLDLPLPQERRRPGSWRGPEREAQEWDRDRLEQAWHLRVPWITLKGCGMGGGSEEGTPPASNLSRAHCGLDHGSYVCHLILVTQKPILSSARLTGEPVHAQRGEAVAEGHTAAALSLLALS